MMTRNPTAFAWLTTAISLLVCTPGIGEENPQPNILLLVAEDMSARVGAFGDTVAVTPSIDQLAEEGVRFPNAFTAAGVCAPNRAALILGMYQTSVGAHNMRTSSYDGSAYLTVPPADVKAFPELLRQAGYYTFASNKLDYQFSKAPAGTGPASIWDYEGGEPGWQRRAPGQPFFGMYHFPETHESRLFPDHPGSTNPESLTKPITPDQVSVPPIYPDTPVVRATIAQHYNNIQGMDERVGTILRQLEEEGLAGNTIVIWTTDHGDGLPRFKREIFDTGIKVPMVIRWPDALRPSNYAPGDVDEQMISFIDLAPTILSMAGLQKPQYEHGQKFPGRSGAESRQYVFAAKDRLDEHPNRERAVRDQQYKYILNYQPGTAGAQSIAYRNQLEIMAELWRLAAGEQLNEEQQAWFLPRPHEALYDTLTDPYETRNLVDDPAYANVLARMKMALSEWQAAIPDLGEIPEAQLADRFWPDGAQPVTAMPMIEPGHDGKVTVTSPIANASIIYRIDGGEQQLYKEPLQLVDGTRLTATAVRYGWQESEPAEFVADTKGENDKD